MIGRDDELSRLTRLVDGLRGSGSAALVAGEAGVGKTALLQAVAARVRARGHRLLRCTGVPNGAAAAFQGLHSLLVPVLDRVDVLPRRQRDALLTAFGRAAGPAPDRLVLGLAVLGLLEDAATRHPVVLIVDDVQWLDPSSREVVEFLGRRLSGAPVLLLVAVRGTADPLRRVVPWTEVIMLAPLTATQSAALLDTLPEQLDPPQRGWVIEEADGNPLALREFSAAVAAGGLNGVPVAIPVIPTTQRLEDTFLIEVSGLPASTQRFLLLVAAAETDTLSELVCAGTLLGLAPGDLSPAEEVGLVSVVDDRVHLRHPLVGSALYGAAGQGERLAVHRALAEATPDVDRATWHQAAVAEGTDETVAAELTASAERLVRRGARSEAVDALRRAAALSPDGGSRSRRLAAAAEGARQAGRPTTAHRLALAALSDADAPEVVSQLVSTLIMLRATAGTAAPDPDETIMLTRQMGGPCGEHEQAHAQVLLGLAVLGWQEGLPTGPRQRLIEALRAIDDAGQLARMGESLLDPAGAGSSLRSALPGLLAELPAYAFADGLESHPGSSQLVRTVGRVSEALQDLPTALACWDLEAAFWQTAPTAVASEAEVLAGRAPLRILAGRPSEALVDADHAVRVAQQLDLPALAALAAAAAALANAWVDDAAATGALSRARELAGNRPPALVAALGHWAAGLHALQYDRPADALAELEAVTVHPTTALWALADRVEAAVHSGDTVTIARADRAVREAEEIAADLPSAHLSMLIARARALLDDPSAETHFRAAESVGQHAGTPLELARTQLAHGEWLRGRGRVVAAREQLLPALHAFDAAGARGWADRAARALRAAGVTPGRRLAAGGPALLTPQEREITRLASTGLTNREIADRVYISHRTVGVHLQRAFRKLGVTRRGQLRAALSADGS